MRILVVAPHPDDETLGCGGTLLKHKSDSDDLYWLIATTINDEYKWSKEKIKKREEEIVEISGLYQFSKTFRLGLATTQLDTIPLTELITKFVAVYEKIKPEIIYMPFRNDVHTDHQIISKALQSTFKWFRYPYLKKVLMYETLSETEYSFIDEPFRPNTFYDISKFLDKKITAMKIYESEIGTFPFPRSEKAIRSLARLRGSQSGYEYAESFQLVYNRSWKK